MNAPLPPKGPSSDIVDGETLPIISDHVLIRRIGKGAYGEVWLARNVIGGFHAAKVVYRRTFSENRPFEREFEGICKFNPISRTHPGLVTILQVGKNLAAGYFYYVMELADDVRTGQKIDADNYMARTLSQEMGLHQRMPLETALPIALSLTSALGYLHSRRLIHRDIKPTNIIFVNGLAKFADIGLLTEAGEGVSFVGSAGYMSPEGPGESTGDIYSLGKVFYGMFMGKPCKSFPELPGAAEEFTSTPALRQINDMILKACHQDPRQRFQTAEELHEALVSITETVRGKPRSFSAAPPARDAAPGKATGTPEGATAAVNEQPPKARWLRRAALLVLLLAIAGAVFLAVDPPKGDANTLPAPTNALVQSNTPIPSNAPAPGFIFHPSIILMDTTATRGVYDADNIRTGGSNADELYKRLLGMDGVLLQKNLDTDKIGLDWARDSVVAAQRPDIVIIHRSSFFHPFAAHLNLDYPPFVDDADGEKLRKWQALYDSQDARLRSFIRAVGAVSPHTQFLIYSTGTDQRWSKPEFLSNWVNTFELELPDLQGRINTMVIEPQPDGKKGTFRDPATMEKVRAQVREMIKKLEKRKAEKAK